MTDRELLELAAKAAGLPECGWMGPAFMYVKENRFTDWNPLTDDGDALRLAVTLKLGVIPFQQDVSATHGLTGREWPEPYGSDPNAATRRAIVRAAASLGKVMP